MVMNDLRLLKHFEVLGLWCSGVQRAENMLNAFYISQRSISKAA
jgi:hypothetical protein